MSIIAALLPNQDRLRRLHAAIRGRHQIAACNDWGALHRLCETQPVSTAVFDLFAHGEMGLEPVRQLRRLFPRLITVAYVSIGGNDRVRDLFDIEKRVLRHILGRAREVPELADGDRVVRAFLAGEPQAADVTESARLLLPGAPPVQDAGPGCALPSGAADADGFYYACLEKRA